MAYAPTESVPGPVMERVRRGPVAVLPRAYRSVNATQTDAVPGECPRRVLKDKPVKVASARRRAVVPNAWPARDVVSGPMDTLSACRWESAQSGRLVCNVLTGNPAQVVAAKGVQRCVWMRARLVARRVSTIKPYNAASSSRADASITPRLRPAQRDNVALSPRGALTHVRRLNVTSRLCGASRVAYRPASKTDMVARCGGRYVDVPWVWHVGALSV